MINFVTSSKDVRYDILQRSSVIKFSCNEDNSMQRCEERIFLRFFCISDRSYYDLERNSSIKRKKSNFQNIQH